MDYEKYLGKNIRSVRQLEGLSQRELADRSGLSDTTISQYENYRKTPNLITTAKIAKALNVSIDRLYYGDENNSFIIAEADDGRKIVNSLYLLWSKGVITYYEFWGRNSSVMIEGDVPGRYLYLKEYEEAIKRLLKSLDEFEEKKDTYSNPEGYLEQILSSVAVEINNQMKVEK